MADDRPLINIVRIELLNIRFDVVDGLTLDEDGRARGRSDDEPVLVILGGVCLVAPDLDDLIPAHDFGDETRTGHAGDEEGRGWGWATIPLRMHVSEFVETTARDVDTTMMMAMTTIIIDVRRICVSFIFGIIIRRSILFVFIVTILLLVIRIGTTIILFIVTIKTRRF